MYEEEFEDAPWPIVEVINGFGLVEFNDNQWCVAEPCDFGWRLLPCYWADRETASSFLRSLEV